MYTHKYCKEYPNYKWYENLEGMWFHIQEQNKDIMEFCKNNWNRIKKVKNNIELAHELEIQYLGEEHNYKQKDIQVYVYK